jgi:microcystin-dependent protein
MAGTIFGIPLSQRVDLNGIPSVGWLLYLYQANTSTPVNSYQDTALTILNPWPIPADAYGMMRQFWLADGNYRARATNQDGSITYFDQLSILALGASSGAAPSGGVDPNAIFQTGDVMWIDRQGTRTGWVRDNGRTLGSATSGAAERANADAQPLFEYLWNNYPDSLCPVVSGRGGSSLSDWTANKQITLPDKRGCAPTGLDDMGNSAATRFTSVPIISGGVTAPGSVIGGNTHTLSAAQMPSHNHTGSGTTDGQNQSHTHSQLASASSGQYTSGGSNGPLGSGSQTGPASNDHTHTFNLTTDPAGSGSAHNNVPRAVVGTFYRKL